MKKTLLTLVATTGIALGGFTAASVAGAQSYGDGGTNEAPAVEETDASGVDTIEIVPIQDEVEPEAPEADGDGERAGRRGHRGRGCDLDTAAEAIGITEDDLRSALDSGESIADVAAANGVDPDTVVDAMAASAAEHLTEKVEAGVLTQDEADERLADKTERITDRVFDLDDAEEQAA